MTIEVGDVVRPSPEAEDLFGRHTDRTWVVLAVRDSPYPGGMDGQTLREVLLSEVGWVVASACERIGDYL